MKTSIKISPPKSPAKPTKPARAPKTTKAVASGPSEPQSTAGPGDATTSGATAATTATPDGSVVSLVPHITEFLDAIEPTLSAQGPALTGIQKRRALKARKGAERYLALLAPIAQQHGLDSESLSSTTLLTRLEDASTLQPVQTRLQNLSKRVSDELFSAQSDAWNMGLQFYAVLRRRAKVDGNVAQALEPVTKAFAYRHALVKADHPTKRETHVKGQLKKATKAAEKHGVTLEPVSGGTSTAAPSAPSAAPSGAGVPPVVAVPPTVSQPPVAAPPVTIAAPAPVAQVAATPVVTAAPPAPAAPSSAPPPQPAPATPGTGTTSSR